MVRAMSDLSKLDATAQAELVAKGEITPSELVDAAIARIEDKNPELNAVITPLFEQARETAAGDLPDGPFRGVPTLMKDIGAMTKGDRFCAGLRVLKDADFRAPVESYYARKLKGAGFVVCGKTNTPELGILPTTEPAAFGATKNPYDLTRSTGGSSGGSAAAVASGMVPIAHANDGGGSIGIPAACCGVFGLKPSRGRTSLGPLVGEVNGGLVAEHVVTRSVRDSAALLDILAGEMPGDPYAAPTPLRPFKEEVGADPGKLKIGFYTKYIEPSGQVDTSHDDCVAAVAHTAKLLESLGHSTEEKAIKAFEDPMYVPSFLAVWSAGVTAGIDSWSMALGKTITKEDVEPLTWALYEMGKPVSASRYMLAWGWLRMNARRAAKFWTDHDLWLTPTVAEPPPPLGTFDPPEGNDILPIFRAAQFAPFTPPFNATGQPAISIPLYKNADGLPIGVQLVAAYGREDLLLRVASQLEAAQPFQHLD
jgi:amidase